MFDMLVKAPSCQELALADYLGGMAAVSGFSEALENSGIFSEISIHSAIVPSRIITFALAFMSQSYETDE